MLYLSLLLLSLITSSIHSNGSLLHIIIFGILKVYCPVKSHFRKFHGFKSLNDVLLNIFQLAHSNISWFFCLCVGGGGGYTCLKILAVLAQVFHELLTLHINKTLCYTQYSVKIDICNENLNLLYVLFGKLSSDYNMCTPLIFRRY